jgi:hypothetical protein
MEPLPDVVLERRAAEHRPSELHRT